MTGNELGRMADTLWSYVHSETHRAFVKSLTAPSEKLSRVLAVSAYPAGRVAFDAGRGVASCCERSADRSMDLLS
jgi:hypothetical protein